MQVVHLLTVLLGITLAVPIWERHWGEWDCQYLSLGMTPSGEKKNLCLMSLDGKIKCAGSGAFGMLGTENSDNIWGINTYYDIIAFGGRKAVTLGVGVDHHCAQFKWGAIICWGKGTNGRLGNGGGAHIGNMAGEMGNSLEAINFGDNLNQPQLVERAYKHRCVVDIEGNAKCWGCNSHGQLGRGHTNDKGDNPGEMGNNLPLMDFGSDLKFVSISTTNDVTCAIMDNGDLKCIGKNDKGQLGLGHTSDIGDSVEELGNAVVSAALGIGRVPKKVCGGDDYICVLLVDGDIKCFGAAAGYGDALLRGDQPSEMGDNLPAIDLGTHGLEITDISCGDAHWCVLYDDGEMKCVGDNGVGQLGLGDANSRGFNANQMGDNLPFIATGEPVVKLEAGSQGTCILFDADDMKCFGDKKWGLVGIGENHQYGDEPNEMGDNLPYIDTDVFGYKTCVRPPTVSPSSAPTNSPSTLTPTSVPIESSPSPSISPTENPSIPVSSSPTTTPTMSPSTTLTQAPSDATEVVPTAAPTLSPTATESPTTQLGIPPSTTASPSASLLPTESPTTTPASVPTSIPTTSPTTATPTTSLETSPEISSSPSASPTSSPNTTSSPTTPISIQPSSSAPTFSPTVGQSIINETLGGSETVDSLIGVDVPSWWSLFHAGLFLAIATFGGVKHRQFDGANVTRSIAYLLIVSRSLAGACLCLLIAVFDWLLDESNATVDNINVALLLLMFLFVFVTNSLIPLGFQELGMSSWVHLSEVSKMNIVLPLIFSTLSTVALAALAIFGWSVITQTYTGTLVHILVYAVSGLLLAHVLVTVHISGLLLWSVEADASDDGHDIVITQARLESAKRVHRFSLLAAVFQITSLGIWLVSTAVIGNPPLDPSTLILVLTLEVLLLLCHLLVFKPVDGVALALHLIQGTETVYAA